MGTLQEPERAPDYNRAEKAAWRDQEFDRGITTGLDTKAGIVLAFLGVFGVELAKEFANYKHPLSTLCIVLLALAAITSTLTIFCALQVLWVRLSGLIIFISIKAAFEYYVLEEDDAEMRCRAATDQRYNTRRIIPIKGFFTNSSVVGCIITVTLLTIALFLR